MSDKPSKIPMIVPRIISALILGPMVLGIVYWGGWAFNILVGLMVWALASEWMRIVGKRPAWILLGLVYITLCSWAIWRLRYEPEWGRVTMFWLLAVVWGADTGGYAFGSTLGGPKLARKISPNKTWSGFVGGTLTSAISGWGLVYLVLNGDEYQIGWKIAAFSAAIAVASQVGDLLESAVKRRFGVKDSGYIIPGHGGMFDRVDGLLAAAFVTIIVSFSINGSVLLW